MCHFKYILVTVATFHTSSPMNHLKHILHGRKRLDNTDSLNSFFIFYLLNSLKRTRHLKEIQETRRGKKTHEGSDKESFAFDRKKTKRVSRKVKMALS